MSGQDLEGSFHVDADSHISETGKSQNIFNLKYRDRAFVSFFVQQEKEKAIFTMLWPLNWSENGQRVLARDDSHSYLADEEQSVQFQNITQYWKLLRTHSFIFSMLKFLTAILWMCSFKTNPNSKSNNLFEKKTLFGMTWNSFYEFDETTWKSLAASCRVLQTQFS